jgi:hypothetical protein
MHMISQILIGREAIDCKLLTLSYQQLSKTTKEKRKILVIITKDLAHHRIVVLAKYRMMGCSQQFIEWLLDYVATALGGVPKPSAAARFIKQSEEHHQQLREESSQNIISLGLAKYGLCKYRALLFKYLVSRSDIYCLL